VTDSSSSSEEHVAKYQRALDRPSIIWNDMQQGNGTWSFVGKSVKIISRVHVVSGRSTGSQMG